MNDKMHIMACVGTRPNFVKIAKLRSLCEKLDFKYTLLHTGQHFDKNMSDVFFSQLSLGEPDYYLGIAEPGINSTVGKIISEVGSVMEQIKPDYVLVPGDVSSTFACAYAASSLDIPVGHIEAGLRSYDRSMPEERNRILTDGISENMFVSEQAGIDNLIKEGFNEDRYHLVGNTIIDTLRLMLPLVSESPVLQNLGADPKEYILCTFHRPVNVDIEDNLREVVKMILAASDFKKVILPLHPRTRARLEKFALMEHLSNENVIICAPLGYIDFLALLKDAWAVLSDSGGIQTEASFLHVPCFTARESTESLMTISHGTNQLIELSENVLNDSLQKMQNEGPKQTKETWLWDGNTTDRILEVVASSMLVS